MGVSMTMVAPLEPQPLSSPCHVGSPTQEVTRKSELKSSLGAEAQRASGDMDCSLKSCRWQLAHANFSASIVTGFPPKKKQPFRSYTRYTPISDTALDRAQWQKKWLITSRSCHWSTGWLSGGNGGNFTQWEKLKSVSTASTASLW